MAAYEALVRDRDYSWVFVCGQEEEMIGVWWSACWDTSWSVSTQSHSTTTIITHIHFPL